LQTVFFLKIGGCLAKIFSRKVCEQNVTNWPPAATVINEWGPKKVKKGMDKNGN